MQFYTVQLCTSNSNALRMLDFKDFLSSMGLRSCSDVFYVLTLFLRTIWAFAIVVLMRSINKIGLPLSMILTFVSVSRYVIQVSY